MKSNIIVVYDISSDIVRRRFSEYLKDIGLERVQLSCFVGRIKEKFVYEIEKKAEELLDFERDRVHVFVLTDNAIKKTIRIGLADLPEEKDVLIF